MVFFEAIIGTTFNVVLSLLVRVASGERRPKRSKVSSPVTTHQSRREHEAIVSVPPHREPQTRPAVIRDYTSLTPRRSPRPVRQRSRDSPLSGTSSTTAGQ